MKHKSRNIALVFLILFCLQWNALAQSSDSEIGEQNDPTKQSIIETDAELTLISDEFKFTEGPAADASGNVLFTDQPNNQIVCYDFKTNKVETWLQPAGRSNGLFYVNRERLIACADEKNELWEINPQTKQSKVISNHFGGRAFGGPNDCWVDQDGSIYFTDPLYRRPYWTQTFENDHPRGVYRVAADGKITQVADDFVQPNGIIGDAKKRILYVADINAGKTYQYKILDNGELAEKKLFCESGSDGMTIDRKGNVYLTGRGVTVYDQSGEKIDHIPVPRGWTANVTFAGPQHQHLFITAGDSVFTIRTKMQGL